MGWEGVIRKLCRIVNGKLNALRVCQRIQEGLMQTSHQNPLYVQVHPSDNVAIIVNEGGLPAGTRFDSGLILTEPIPEAHKVALSDISQGDRVVRYGVNSGHAERDIVRGSWVHEGILTLLEPPELGHLPL